MSERVTLWAVVGLVGAGRSEERMQPGLDEIHATGNPDVTYLPLDLGELASVRARAERFLATGRPRRVLIDNAGLAGQTGLTTDGFEMTFGVNHLGDFLLTHLLLPRLKESAPSRVVSVASRAHDRAERIDSRARVVERARLRRAQGAKAEGGGPRRRAGRRAVASQRRVVRLGRLTAAPVIGAAGTR